MKLPEIIGISGTNGAGKDTLADVRHDLTGAEHVSLSDILRHELGLRGIAATRENLANLSHDWRVETGDYGTLSTRTIERYLGQTARLGLSITSVRHPEEARRIQEHGGKIIWVDADPEIRYTRIQLAQRDRIDDEVTRFMFFEQEKKARELAAADPAHISLHAVEPLADEHVINNFDSPEAYIEYLKERYFSE